MTSQGSDAKDLAQALQAPQEAPARSGQSSVLQGKERSYTLVVLVNDRPGAVDRVVGLLRRRRASMQTLVIGPSELPGVVRITVNLNDSEVELVKVNSKAENYAEIIELGHLFGAHTVDVTSGTITLEVTGSEEKVEKLVNELQKYGIREVARTGPVAITRGTGNS